MKYIDADKLIAEIERRIGIKENLSKRPEMSDMEESLQDIINAYQSLKSFITSLQQEQPIGGKQVIIITETDGDANIHWDCRSLDDVMALLTSAKSFIADKQTEELRGQGSGPDYNTEESRYSHLFKRQQEQPKGDFEQNIEMEWDSFNKHLAKYDEESEEVVWLNWLSFVDIAKHFCELGRTRKEESK